MAASLLVELLVEELPPKALKSLGASFAATLTAALQNDRMLENGSHTTGFATPRRLGVHITAVRSEGEPRLMADITLMPASVGLDAQGNWTPPLIKKLHGKFSTSADLESLRRERVFVMTEGGKEVIKLRGEVASGGTLLVALEGALLEAIDKLPIPKLMQYQLHTGNTPGFQPGWTTVSFVRPAHGLVALHGDSIVAVQALGLHAGRTTQGHRFEALQPTIHLRSADTYAQQLRDEGAVIASFTERRLELQRQLTAAADREGLTAIDDDALFDEVTGLVERPNVLLCRFEEAFLTVPQECLILTMKANQKYFPLLDGDGRLSNRFLVVSNITPPDPGRVIQGNERVVRPRLADAKFFFDQDRKKTLESRVPQLAKVVYHGKLGTQGERVERVRAIARWVASEIGADIEHADRAALLAKADLVTEMVGEFPELQGIMGGYYARHDGEPEEVAQAIADQYIVRRDEQVDAENPVSESLLLADRSETLIGMWAVGQRPTGDKDPFALRRQALGIIKSFELCGATAAFAREPFDLTLSALLAKAAEVFPSGVVKADVQREVEQFVYERYANQLGGLFGVQQVDAVVSQRPPLHQVVGRLRAVVNFSRLPEAPALAAANKRVGNILKKSEAQSQAERSVVDPALLAEPAESALAHALQAAEPVSTAAFDKGDYTASLQALAVLKVPVDAFFDNVMVNADDPALRRNRLALLARLHASMNRVADLSRLAS